jgi:hypothetical protein
MAPVTIAPVATYNAICQREGDWWVITVPELESGGVTQARSLDEVPSTVADLVALMTGADATTVEVSVQVHKPLITWSRALRGIGLIACVGGIVAIILLINNNNVAVGIANWVAIGAALTAVVTVYFTAQASRAAIRAARAAEEQIKIQWQQHMDAAQPYIWVDIRPDEVTGTLLNLAIGNSGQTSAENIRVEVDPSLPAVDQLAERIAATQDRLTAGLSSLPPGRTLSWPLGPGFALLSGKAPKAYRFTVSADGPFGPMSPRTYLIDLDDLRGTLDRPSPIYQLTKAVESLTGKLEREQ